jgi:AbrB family looped-hinge helix DNA binding protein
MLFLSKKQPASVSPTPGRFSERNALRAGSVSICYYDTHPLIFSPSSPIEGLEKFYRVPKRLYGCMRQRTTTVKVDERGRVYIPKPVREALGFEGEETTVEITVKVEDGDE